MLGFQQLQQRLILHVRQRVRSGEITERGIARLTGISQPHIHHVLKGKRWLSMDAADSVLRALHVDLRDLIQTEDSADRLHHRH